MPYTYKYPRPMVTVDIFLLRGQEGDTQILLIQRKNEPFKAKWALPGGYVDENESLEQAAHRELKEETNLDNISLQQLGAFGDPGRDPRGHTITIVYGAKISTKLSFNTQAGDDASNARWFPTERLPDLAFDHDKIIRVCLEKLQTS